jgi:mannose-6-phosphate isomerase-like protein (cupin superfamily)
MKNGGDEMVVVRLDEVKGIWTSSPHHRELRVLLSPYLQDVSEDLAIGVVMIPPGESGEPHTHETGQEVWYGLAGKGRLRIGDEEAELLPDTIVVAPAGIEHQIFNDGDELLKSIFIFTPAGPEKRLIPTGE